MQAEFSEKYLSPETRLKIVKDYQKSINRLFLLDYDGTLISTSYKFKKVKPDKKTLNIIQQLIKDKKNQVVIVSGREKETLEKWFANINVGLVAGHGTWLREKIGQWKTVKPLINKWKDQIRPLLELYVDRTPGSFIQEKEHSLVWHYIKTESSFGRMRALELKYFSFTPYF